MIYEDKLRFTYQKRWIFGIATFNNQRLKYSHKGRTWVMLPLSLAMKPQDTVYI